MVAAAPSGGGGGGGRWWRRRPLVAEEGGDGGAAATFPSRIPSPLVIPDPTGPEACGRGGDLQGKGDTRIDPAMDRSLREKEKMRASVFNKRSRGC
ncbi:unnamed protein product [Triticum turgidum subsp. durum]|uniref:Uncharacterized protein n=1 Tax=Triticum turgidum subsp. durum TaxID=4567 RepID=A0A9R1Q672_TRITD|nr:unnamed protein product [Triticum turgidum subsp. durum]